MSDAVDSSARPPPLLEVRGVSRRFGPLVAVDEVSFTLEAGSILGFIGPNGAGKSTTMRIIATLDVPCDGDVVFAGRSVVAAPDAARPLIGYMPDRYGVYEDTSVAEFLDFFARAYRIPRAERRDRVRSVMDFTGLTPLADKLTTELSKGMRQRVALGRTLLNEPRLLVLDEPADGLDPRARIELRALLEALAGQGKAVLISSHILTELSEICDTCAIIERGKLLATGPVSEVLARAAGATPSAELVVRVLATHGEREAIAARAERVLLEQPLVTAVTVDGARLHVTLSHSDDRPPAPHWVDERCAALVQALVRADVPVCGLATKELDLEDAFMHVTGGRVA